MSAAHCTRKGECWKQNKQNCYQLKVRLLLINLSFCFIDIHINQLSLIFQDTQDGQLPKCAWILGVGLTTYMLALSE